MTRGRCRAQWDHTASLLLLLASIHRNPKKKAPALADFHPYRRERPKPREKMPLKALKGLFTEGRMRWQDLEHYIRN